MIESPAPQPGIGQQRLKRLGAVAKKAALFGSGILVALAALVIYNNLFPPIHPLTTNEVNDVVAQALASATPRPPFSVRVYQAIQPSLVLIQTRAQDVGEEVDYGLGSGVVIDDSGRILTSLHVVENASEIQVTFADGMQTEALLLDSQPENDIAILVPILLPELLVPAVLGNINAMRVGDEVFAVGNPFGLYSSLSAGIISGFDRAFKPTNSSQI